MGHVWIFQPFPNISTPLSTVTTSGHFQVLLWNSVDKETVKRIDEF